jgi:hypothetical protein
MANLARNIREKRPACRKKHIAGNSDATQVVPLVFVQICRLVNDFRPCIPHGPVYGGSATFARPYFRGSDMRKKKLNRDDENAVDLLLDEQVINLSDSGIFVKSVNVEHHRVKSAKQILDLLKQLPQVEPSADLTGRTLHKINSLSAADGSAILRPTTSDNRGPNASSNQRPQPPPSGGPYESF